MATASTDLHFANHPHDGTAEDILKYTLTTEIMSTAKIGCYSGNKFNMYHIWCFSDCTLGILQMLFVAGATKFARQHTELPRDGYDTTIFPCGCTDVKGILDVMWVTTDPQSTTLNHILPLLPKSKFHIQSVHLVTVVEPQENVLLKLKQRKGQPLYGKAFSMVFVFSVLLLVFRQVVIWYNVIPVQSGTIPLVLELTSSILVMKLCFAAVKKHKKIFSMF